MPSNGSIVLLRALTLGATPRCGGVRLVCVDGPAGSGKTTLAEELAAVLPGSPVVHMDDLYRGWEQDLGDPLAQRVGAWLLDAWAVGLPGRHLRFDWHASRFAEWVEVPAAPVVIVEGCGSASAGIREHASIVAWVEADPAVRLERGIARDGVGMRAAWLAWQEREAAHFTADGTAAAAHLVVRT